MIENERQSVVGYLVRSYPRLTQTFVLNEILGLERLGLPIHVFAGSSADEPVVQAETAAVRAPVEYLDKPQRPTRLAVLGEQAAACFSAPVPYLRTLAYVVRHPELDKGYVAASRYACFLQAVRLAHKVRSARRTGKSIDHLHAHFAHDPTLIALLTAMLTGIPYSFTAHARDLYGVPADLLIERALSARAVVTCCEANVDYLRSILPDRLAERVHLIHHGVDVSRFHPRRSEEAPVPALILAVGRLVEKKGFGDLLRACERLQTCGYDFTCEIYGEGPQRRALEALRNELGLESLVRFQGARPQAELVEAFARATIFALVPAITEDGDRDGIPNVLVEAMACALPVVSTAVAGIPELIAHDWNGLLVQPHDVGAIASALASLLDDPTKRAALGAVARQTVLTDYDSRCAALRLAALFGDMLEAKQ